MKNLPLAGIRVLDLTQVYAGPLASRRLADMGAEVIRIESVARSTRGGPDPQPGAVYPDNDPGKKPYNRSAYYNELNLGKLAISLNLSITQGKEIFKKLILISDVVIENFSPRVMANFELDYNALQKIKPEIIMASISAYGHTGPYRNYVSFGRGIEAMSGLSQMTSYPDSQPLGPGTAYADATGGLHATFAILVALRHLSQTGKGQHIDLSLRESLMAITWQQEHSSATIFESCYQCLGNDKWIAIAIESEGEWTAFCNATGITAELENEKMDELIRQWTMRHKPDEAMSILQRAGIRAGAVLDAAEINQNHHLRERGFFEQVTHPEAGTHPYPSTPWKMSNMPCRIPPPAPCFAEHNEYVFGELLGMSKEEIAELEEIGVAVRVPRR